MELHATGGSAVWHGRITLVIIGLFLTMHGLTAPLPPVRAHEIPIRPVLTQPEQGARLSGAMLRIETRIDAPVSLRPRLYMTALLTLPDGMIERITLHDNGQFGDRVPYDGIYSAAVPTPDQAGTYQLLVKAWHRGKEAWSKSILFTLEQPRPSPWGRILLFFSGILAAGASTWWLLRRSPGTETLREIRRSRVAVEAIYEAIAGERNATEALLREVKHDILKYKHLDRELTRVRLDVEDAQQESERWKTSAMEYLDTLHRGIVNLGDDLRASTLARDADIFARYCAARGLERITPQSGDPLISEFIQVVGVEDSETLPPETILACREWGYRSGTMVYKRAQVILTRSPIMHDITSRVMSTLPD